LSAPALRGFHLGAPSSNALCYNSSVASGGFNFNLRDLPSVSSLLAEKQLADIAERESIPAALCKSVMQEALQAMRASRSKRGKQLDKPQLTKLVVSDVAARLEEIALTAMRPVINATGILVHTNLGRSPLGDALWSEGGERLRGYLNLEYDLVRGRRSRRGILGERLLTELSGAEAALVVNNNAAAVFLTLHTLCRRREVIVSRGELPQIGGGFRIPDIIRTSGAKLVEVGTTNRTTAEDYAKRITERTAALLKVHQSNFQQTGFVAQASVAELSALAREHNLHLLEDAGAATLIPLPLAHQWELTHPADSLALGVDLYSFSGDKVLGLTQGGIILGKQELIQKLRKSPLYRTFRPDRTLLTMLERGLTHLVKGEVDAIPLYRMFAQKPAKVQRRARKLAKLLKEVGIACEVVKTTAEVGGGYPARTLPSHALSIGRETLGSGAKLHRLAGFLRRGRPSVIATVRESQLLLDLRTVLPQEETELIAALKAAYRKLQANQKVVL